MTESEKNILKEFIIAKIPEINVELSCDILLVTISGSYASGTQSEQSDVDFAAMASYQKGKGECVHRVPETIYLDGKKKEVEIIIHDADYVLNMAEAALRSSISFPTIKKRTDEEQQMWDSICKKHKSWQRPDGWKECIEYFCFSKKNLLFISMQGKEVMKKMQYLAKEENILDYIYTRMYANLFREIQNKDKIKTKKYISIVFMGLLSDYIRGHIQSEEINYQTLLNMDETVTDELKYDMLCLLENHRCGEKEVLCNERINEWIQTRIDMLDEYFIELGGIMI